MKFSMKAATLLATFCAFTAQADIINTYEIDFENQSLTAHQQSDGNYYTWNNAGSVLSLQENAWYTLNLDDAFGIQSLDLDNANSSYQLSFEFRMKASNDDPAAYSEIAGIWLADFSGGEQNYDASRTFALAGTQNFGLDDFTYTSEPQWASFSITLDDYLSGLITDIVFINDCDASAGCNDMTVRFRNASISEVSEPTAMSLILLGIGFMGWRARRQK
ncbi:PEP-CTERM sorting domain-containing protein [Alteromonas sp. 14N.309.X.WAT.G.H12]|uniref:PEP-CTERM sorting domain-containing protein n=1 Tax=Alteromonas sp. 14N.309.X.WAT.G.H12 TaxID=3120824 RepID=UPI002FCF2D43